MGQSDISRAGFIRDDLSRLLALSDALDHAHGPGISQAFLDIARAKGIAQIAREAGLCEDEIYAALADPARPDLTVLGGVVASMLRLLPGLAADDARRLEDRT